MTRSQDAAWGVNPSAVPWISGAVAVLKSRVCVTTYHFEQRLRHVSGNPPELPGSIERCFVRYALHEDCRQLAQSSPNLGGQDAVADCACIP
jgi:hypothetical protein